MRQLLYILIGFLTLLSVSCITETTDNTDEVVKIEQTNDFPYLIDTFDYKTIVKAQNELGVANYHPLYFGTKKDTIFIDYKLPQYSLPPPTPIIVSGDTLFMPANQSDYETMNSNHEKYSDYFQLIAVVEYLDWDSAIFEIKVDTTKTIRNIDFEILQDSSFVYRAYPVIIENKTDQNVSIGFGSHIELLLEAKNKNGEWQTIEKPYRYFCATGLPIIILPHNEMVLTSVPIFEGDFKTDFRLKIGKNYSEAFKGVIALGQFEQGTN